VPAPSLGKRLFARTKYTISGTLKETERIYNRQNTQQDRQNKRLQRQQAILQQKLDTLIGNGAKP